MANFPTSVFSPAARSNGQVIDASHVNSLQEEVTAIEDGFRNATAPLNSSKSTLASLHVTGGSTLAGTLQVVGQCTLGSLVVAGGSNLASVSAVGSTLGTLNVTGTLQVVGQSTLGSLNVTGGSNFTGLSAGGSTLTTLNVTGGSTFAVRPTMPLPDLAILGVALAQDISATTSAISWTTQQALTNSSLHSTTTNPTRLTPQSTGVYVFSANICLSGTLNQSTSELFARIEDSSVASMGSAQVLGVSNNVASISFSAMKRFDAIGGWVRVVVEARDGSTASVRVGGTNVSMCKLL